jgi:hypothetical protein
MARARGNTYRTWQLERCPFLAEIIVPGSGLRTHLDAMNAWLRKHCQADHATAHRFDKVDPMKPVEWLQFRFADDATAQTFADSFGLMYRGAVPVGRGRRCSTMKG